jgi:hypothetical protein
MIIDSTSHNEAFFRSDIIHDERLKHSCIDLFNITFEAVMRHAQGIVTKSSSKQSVLVIGKGVIFLQVVLKVMTLSVLRFGNICSEDRPRLESAVDHHLEHVDYIILNTMTSEIGRLLIVFHCHVSATHLNHAIVNGLISVLKCLQICVLKSQ